MSRVLVPTHLQVLRSIFMDSRCTARSHNGQRVCLRFRWRYPVPITKGMKISSDYDAGPWPRPIPEDTWKNWQTWKGSRGPSTLPLSRGGLWNIANAFAMKNEYVSHVLNSGANKYRNYRTWAWHLGRGARPARVDITWLYMSVYVFAIYGDFFVTFVVWPFQVSMMYSSALRSLWIFTYTSGPHTLKGN